ncbi:MAG: hypothetical protein ACON4T_03395 [Synechococcus sp.]
MAVFEGKRLLLVAPPFFGYYKEIIVEIQSQGGVVDWLPDRPLDHPIGKTLTRFAPCLASKLADFTYYDLLANYGASSYDYVLVINGQTLSKRLLRSLRSSFPAALFILYMWDSVANRSHISGNFSSFDRVLTFDPSDAEHFGLRLRPLFFTNQFSQVTPPDGFAWDLSFVGTAHSDRYEVVSLLKRNLSPDLRSFWYLYIQAPWVFHVYRLVKPGMFRSRFDEFSFSPLTMESVKKIFTGSRAVLDITHPRQRGLTMRTFETLGASKKLVTTNAAICEYDFYDAANIMVIDRRSPFVDPSFFRAEFSPLSENIVSRYSLSGWIGEVFDV